jgi:hypothetical protein
MRKTAVIVSVQTNNQWDPVRPRSLRHQISWITHRPATNPAAMLCKRTTKVAMPPSAMGTSIRHRRHDTSARHCDFARSAQVIRVTSPQFRHRGGL